MTELIDMSATVALDRLAAWKIALRAENKRPGTVTIYVDCVSRYLRRCAEHDHLPMSRACLNHWVADMLDAGAAPGTARIRQQAVRRVASWLTAGGELPVDPFPGMKAISCVLVFSCMERAASASCRRNESGGSMSGHYSGSRPGWLPSWT